MWPAELRLGRSTCPAGSLGLGGSCAPSGTPVGNGEVGEGGRGRWGRGEGGWRGRGKREGGEKGGRGR